MRSICSIDSLQFYIAGENGVLLKTSDAGNLWEILSDGFYDPANLDFAGFTSDTHGWTCSRSGGEIYHTYDGGTTWTGNGSIPSGVSDIVFTNADQGWRVDNGCTIFKTSDGGKSWDINYQTNEFENYAHVFFINPQLGWVAGSIYVETLWDFTQKYLMLKTTDGGQSWSRKIFLSPPLDLAWTEVRDLYFTDELHGWAIGVTSGWIPPDWGYYFITEVLKTTNGGSSWSVIANYSLPPHYGGYKIFFADNNVGWVIHPWGYLYKSNNGGNNWFLVNDSVNPSEVYFRDTENGWAVCQDGNILHSADGGLTWEYEDSPSSDPLNRIFFSENGNGWAFGNGSTILHLADSTMVSLEDLQRSYLPQLFAYPNPFSISTMIDYELKENTPVKLSIFNSLGKEVDVLLNERQSKGSKQFQWNAAELPAGIYYCRLQAGSQIVTNIMIKIP